MNLYMLELAVEMWYRLSISNLKIRNWAFLALQVENATSDLI